MQKNLVTGAAIVSIAAVVVLVTQNSGMLQGSVLPPTATSPATVGPSSATFCAAPSWQCGTRGCCIGSQICDTSTNPEGICNPSTPPTPPTPPTDPDPPPPSTTCENRKENQRIEKSVRASGVDPDAACENATEEANLQCEGFTKDPPPCAPPTGCHGTVVKSGAEITGEHPQKTGKGGFCVVNFTCVNTRECSGPPSEGSSYSRS